MPPAEELEALRRWATAAFADLSSSAASRPRADLPVLLRRCLLLLHLLDAGNPSLAARCCRRLLASLRGVLARNPSASCLPALEVFSESLVFSDRLRSFFATIDFAAQEGSRAFTVAPPSQGELHILLELVCCHFISSLQDESGFEAFFSALSWSGKGSQGAPKIGFLGALALVHRTCLFSLPPVVQAHLLLLASRCISGRDLDSHSLAFEHAMNLYVKYLPALGVFIRTGGVETPLSCLAKKRPFKCCIKDATDQKLISQINGLLSFCQLHCGDDLPINESDIFASSDRLIEDNQHMLHENFRQETTLVVKSILSNILRSAKQREMHESDAEVSQEIICLAAVLRLMGSSLQQILHQFSRMRSATDKENGNYAALHKEYNVIFEIIHLLGQHEANELHRYDLLGIIGKSVDRERASILLLAHFASLSICCVRRRLGFLLKGCIIMIIMAINVVIAEEESLCIFQPLIDTSKKSAVFPNTKNGNLKVYVRRKSSKAIALQFKNIHKIRSPNKGGNVSGDGSSLGTPQKCNSRVGKADGRAFFKCLPGYRPNSSEWKAIVDFVECKQGKDYLNSLKQHKKFKIFKDKKRFSKRLSMMESAMEFLGMEM
ncbi:uncharacterized protein LOC133922160 [Phragmites australis]|uniref:uncharacterized protein LOC133922160 n=1 Tax=Phragmites australis TaxID=29695 RepID=UPI002D77E901|nr:uncharacterized protein LOC133922160 [Phragmites australis]